MKKRIFSPPELSAPGRVLYVALRMVHLLFVTAALPMALSYWKFFSGTAAAGSWWTGWVLIPGSLFWALFFIVLEQYSYPANLYWAFVSTGSLLFNAWTGLRISEAQLFYGAYQIFISGLVAQILCISAAAIWFVREKGKHNDRIKHVSWNYLWLLGLLVSGAAVMVLVLVPPLAGELMQESDVVLAIMACAGLAIQAVFHCRTLIAGSIFTRAVAGNELRAGLHEGWSPFIAVGIIISIMAALGIAMMEARPAL